jgi:hypothetical protein
MRKHILLSVLILFFAILISCIGNSVRPYEREIIGWWGLEEINCYDASFNPIGPYSLITHVYNPNYTYAIYSGDSMIEGGHYIIQDENKDSLTIMLKPSNRIYSIIIVNDTMWMRMPDVFGACTSIFCRISD